jgi:hypothetical protein
LLAVPRQRRWRARGQPDRHRSSHAQNRIHPLRTRKMHFWRWLVRRSAGERHYGAPDRRTPAAALCPRHDPFPSCRRSLRVPLRAAKRAIPQHVPWPAGRRADRPSRQCRARASSRLPPGLPLDRSRWRRARGCRRARWGKWWMLGLAARKAVCRPPPLRPLACRLGIHRHRGPWQPPWPLSLRRAAPPGWLDLRWRPPRPRWRPGPLRRHRPRPRGAVARDRRASRPSRWSPRWHASPRRACAR